jgi:hypothetical protein
MGKAYAIALAILAAVGFFLHPNGKRLVGLIIATLGL